MRKVRAVVDTDNAAAIDGLIPGAVAFANREIRKADVGRDRRSVEWNRLFHGEMDRLAVSAGLRRAMA